MCCNGCGCVGGGWVVLGYGGGCTMVGGQLISCLVERERERDLTMRKKKNKILIYTTIVTCEKPCLSRDNGGLLLLFSLLRLRVVQ